MSANPVVNDACVLLYQTLHTRLPVRLASGFPCALFLKSARNEGQNLGRTVPRDDFACLLPPLVDDRYLVADTCSAADEGIAQASAHLPGAGLDAFVRMAFRVTCPTRDVGTSGSAIDGLILTAQGCRGLRRRDEENSGAYQCDREKLPGHVGPPFVANIGVLLRQTLQGFA
jgi:hypothetical protein